MHTFICVCIHICITGKFNVLADAVKKIEYIQTYTHIHTYTHIQTYIYKYIIIIRIRIRIRIRIIRRRITGKFNVLADAVKKIEYIQTYTQIYMYIQS
jgi:hypothetical protein